MTVCPECENEKVLTCTQVMAIGDTFLNGSKMRKFKECSSCGHKWNIGFYEVLTVPVGVKISEDEWHALDAKKMLPC